MRFFLTGNFIPINNPQTKEKDGGQTKIVRWELGFRGLNGTAGHMRPQSLGLFSNIPPGYY